MSDSLLVHAGDMRRGELQAILRLAFEAADAADVPAFADVCLAGLHDLVRSDIVSYNEVDSELGLEFAVASPGDWVTPSLLERFGVHLDQHPLVSHFRATGDGRALKISDFVGRAAFHELDLYREFYAPIGIEYQIAFTLPSRRSLVVGIALNRGDRDFSEHDRACLNVLRPHLAYAHRRLLERAQLGSRVHALEAAADEMDDGLVIADADARITYASRSARELVRSFFGHELGGRLPRELRVGTLRRDGRVLHVRRAGDEEAGVLVLSRGAPPGAFGLTPRESEVLASVADGLTDAQIAQALHVSRSTVSKHVANILAKLEVGTRAAAVARVFGRR